MSVRINRPVRVSNLFTAGSLRRSLLARPQLMRLEDRTVPATANFTVGGLAQWTDAAGGKHAIPLAAVEILEHDGATTQVIGNATTDFAGKYSVNLSFDDGAGDGDPDVSVRVLAKSSAVDVRPDDAKSVTYSISSKTFLEVADKSTVAVPDLVAGNKALNEVAFSVFNSVQLANQYAGTLFGKSPSTIVTRFDVDATIPVSHFDGTELNIRETAGQEWDVIWHEFGHYVMSTGGFESNPGGKHSSSDNLTVSRGNKDIGIRLAWGEGWPTYFAISGQMLMGAAGLKIPNVGDTAYTARGGKINYDLETAVGKGEDNEKSVLTVLWDAWDAVADGVDNVSITDRTLFNTFKSAAPTTVGAAWEALAATVDTAGKTRIGAIFGQNKIAPELTAPADNVTIGATPPAFTWTKNGGGAANPLNDFRIKFYKSDFSSVVFQKDLGDVDTFTPTAAEWSTITGGDKLVKWVIEGKDTRAPATPGGTLGYYWSGARTIGGGLPIVLVIDDTGSMSEEIGGVRTALQQYIDLVASKLKAGGAPPTIQLITFKDNVTVRITSNDLTAVRAAVGALVASGGGDCPEFSAQALAVAADNVTAGGTILLATDASTQPGVDLAGVIAKLRAKRVTVNTILSGDCGSIGSSRPAGAVVDDDCPDQGPSDPIPVVVGPMPTTSFETGSSGPVYESGEGGFPSDDDTHTPIVDPGQPAIDEYSNVIADAQPLAINAGPRAGAVGGAGDPADVFSLALTPGVRYAVLINTTDGSSLSVRLLKADGSVVTSGFVGASNALIFKPTEANLFLSVERTGSAVGYYVSVTDNPIAGTFSAVDLFSTVSALTGGVFLVHDEVNSGDSAGYSAAIFNTLASTLGPVVLSSNPAGVPRGQTLAVTLTGRSTNWLTGSTKVAFANAGIEVLSVSVNSATSLTALVRVDAAVPIATYDVTVTTTLGSATETATGFGALRVTAAVTAPTLLSADPGVLSQGGTVTVTVRGANVAWDAATAVTMGPGVKINSVKLVNPMQLDVNVTVEAGADIGFRTVVVTQAGQSDLTLTRGVFVSAAGVQIAQLVSLSPNSLRVGRSAEVTVTGDLTHFAAGKTTADFGAGVTVLGVAVLSPTQAVVTVRVDAGAALGFRSVSLTTDGETAVLINGFLVSEGVSVAESPIVALTPGPGATSVVQLVDARTGKVLRQFSPFGDAYTGGVWVASGDLNGDGTQDALVGAGFGGGPHVKAIDGATGALLFSFFAYDASFLGGVHVALGDVNADGTPDMITGAGPSGGPHVKVFDGITGKEVRSFFAYDAGFRGGVFVASDDLNGDGNDDIVTGAGYGGGPHVKVIDGRTLFEIRSFFAYDASFLGGVSVATGDVDGDGNPDVITGAGRSGGPHVKVFDGVTGRETRSFFAFDAVFLGGVSVATANLDDDNLADFLVAAGPSGGAHIKEYTGASTQEFRSFFAYDPAFTGGIFVG